MSSTGRAARLYSFETILLLLHCKYLVTFCGKTLEKGLACLGGVFSWRDEIEYCLRHLPQCIYRKDPTSYPVFDNLLVYVLLILGFVWDVFHIQVKIPELLS